VSDAVIQQIIHNALLNQKKELPSEPAECMKHVADNVLFRTQTNLQIHKSANIVFFDD
jgi:hypothetical protein